MTVICQCGRVMVQKPNVPNTYICTHCIHSISMLEDCPKKDATICPICHEPT